MDFYLFYIHHAWPSAYFLWIVLKYKKPRIFIIVVFSCFFWYVVMIHFLENVNNTFQDGGYIYIYTYVRVCSMYLFICTLKCEKRLIQKKTCFESLTCLTHVFVSLKLKSNRAVLSLFPTMYVNEGYFVQFKKTTSRKNY